MATITQWQNLGETKIRHYSQTNEDGILIGIFDLIGPTNKVAVEFGGGDGDNLSNTRYFREQGWSVLLLDSDPQSDIVVKELITAENVNAVFAKYGVPQDFDLLSIDVDGNDYWIWKALTYKPRVLVIEFNGSVQPTESKTIPYDPNFKHDATDYYGVSLAALNKLGTEKGYTLVAQTNALNAFYVRQELIPAEWTPNITYVASQYHPPDKKCRPWQSV